VLSEADFFRRLREGRSSLAVQRFSCWTGDAQTFYDKVIHSRRPELGYGVFNYSYAESPVAGLDAEIEAARRDMDPRRRLAALGALTQRVLAASLAIPLLQERDHVFASPDLEWAPRADTFRLVSEMRFREAQSLTVR
jgi:ABC-type oligopeptide transport system substrate-binding subunit